MRIVLVAGARPNFVKVAPLGPALDSVGAEVRLIHTGQHFDHAMSGSFFDDLGIRAPDVDLGVGAGTHAEQTGRIMIAFEKLLLEDRPDLVIVVGDVNSTLACALAAAKVQVPVAHVEAGLRSFDRSMPEEINRVLTDALSQLCFTTEPSADANLLRESVDRSRIHLVGNVMIDTLLRNRARARRPAVLDGQGLRDRGYAMLTMHRPSNVDRADEARRLLDAIDRVRARLPVVFAVHPRTAQMLERHGLSARVRAMAGLLTTGPLPYLEFLYLLDHAAVVLTDSGGIQEETTVLGVPCLTLRSNTERPITIEQGTNRLVGMDLRAIETALDEIGAGRWPTARVPALWDGHAAERIANVVVRSHRGT